MNRILMGTAAAAALALSALSAHAAGHAADVTIGMQLEPPVLDPTAGAAAAIDEITYSNIFEGLVKFGEDGSINPGLANAWKIDPFGLVYTFELRKGVKTRQQARAPAVQMSALVCPIGCTVGSPGQS